MTRYFFDLWERDLLIADESGQDLPDIEAAQRKAIDALGDAIRDHRIQGPEDRISIDIRSGGDEPIMTVSAVLRIGRRG